MSPPIGSARAGLVSQVGDAIPDTSIFQSPIYQWYGGAIGASDSTSPVDWPESLAGLSDATAVDGPTKTTQSGKEGVQYDGSNDGHDWSSDAKLPTGQDANFSVAVTFYTEDTSSLKSLTGFGSGDEVFLSLGDTQSYRVRLQNSVDVTGGTYSSFSLDTIGFSHDETNNQIELYGGGTNVASDAKSEQPSDSNHSHGYESNSNQFFADVFIHDIVYSSQVEPAQTFTDYHNDRV